jgi:hypothetical protein
MADVEEAMRFLSEEKSIEWTPTIGQIKSGVISMRVRKNPSAAGAQMGAEECDYCSDTGWIVHLVGLPEGEMVDATFNKLDYKSFRYPGWPCENTSSSPCPRCQSGEHMLQTSFCNKWSQYGRRYMDRVARWVARQPEDSKYSMRHNHMNRIENARKGHHMFAQGSVGSIVDTVVKSVDAEAPVVAENQMAFLDEI